MLFLKIVPLVLSSSIVVAADGGHLACVEFSLSENVHFGNYEFITDYFGGLSLSPPPPRRGDEGAAFVGSTHRGASPHSGP
jgi:hypothetical protein